MLAADKNALTSVALTAAVLECVKDAVASAQSYGRSTVSICVTASRLASEYGAPEPAKQPRDLAPTKIGGRLWTITRGRLGNGRVVWTARAAIAGEV